MESVAASGAREDKAAKVLYGVVFAVIVPVALVAWAHGSSGIIHVPVMHDRIYGALAIAAGILIMLEGMLALWTKGGGLPMNAFPPKRFVGGGVYALVPHPIYGGFVVACAGVAVFSGSASGLWLITPAVALGCAAVVLGYEMPDLRSRFGPQRQTPWLPREGPQSPTALERLRIYLVVIVPWFVGYELIGHLGSPPEAIQTYLGFERSWPVLAWAEPLYFSTYAAVLLLPLFARSGHALRQFAVLGYTGIALVFPAFVLLPFYVPPRPFMPTGFFGAWLGWERSPLSGMAGFPAFHVVWSCIVASVVWSAWRRLRMLGWIWAALVGASCVATGMHSIGDVIAGFAVFVVIAKMPAIWSAILRSAERVANSWCEWRVGPVRIINHGAYAGAAAAAGILIIDTLLGPGRSVVSLAICIGALVGAAVWAQWVEGSPALLRPLGFYGGMIGSMIGATVALAMGVPLWSAFAVICLAAPWIQLLGRLRCLVQGCCHGRPAQTVDGIRYTHPRSRVCRIAHFDGVAVHATPVYSMLWNIVVGLLLFRLITLHTPAALVCGIYLLLSGCGRFVEEAYRGEPQTRIFAGLRFYQWIAIVSVIAGAAITCVRGTGALPLLHMRLSTPLLAFACGLLSWFVAGVDFPESNRRFARLT